MKFENQKTKEKYHEIRWCPKKEQRIATAVCRDKAKTQKRCSQCMAKWMQLSLFD